MQSVDWSIILPTHGRNAHLAQTLAALDRLDARSDSFEVIVVDDGSPQPVVLSETRLQVRVVRQQRSGPAAARNRGARQAAAPILIFLDDDCRPQPAWLREITARVAPDTAVGGVIRNGLRQNTFAEASDLLLREFTNSQYSQPSASFEFLPTANLAVPKEAFWQVGGFHEGFPLAAAEDRDFCHRWRARGYRLQVAPQAIVDHFHEMRWRGFLRQHYSYGRGARLYYSLHRDAPRMTRGFYVRLCKAALTHGAVLGGLLAASQLASTAGYFARRI